MIALGYLLELKPLDRASQLYSIRHWHTQLVVYRLSLGKLLLWQPLPAISKSHLHHSWPCKIEKRKAEKYSSLWWPYEMVTQKLCTWIKLCGQSCLSLLFP